MSKKCESCGSPVVTGRGPSGFTEHHREGGLDCVRTQLAQSAVHMVILHKILNYVHFVLTDGGPIDGDLGNSVQLAADRIKARAVEAGAQVERLRGAIRAALRHDLAPGGWGGPAAENILIKALAAKPKALSTAEGGAEE